MYIPTEKIDLGRTSGGTIAGWSDSSGYSVTGTVATASPAGGWDVSDCIEVIPQSVADTVLYGVVGFVIPNKIPFAPYTLRLFSGWEALSGTNTTNVSINGHSHGSITHSVAKKLYQSVYQVCADIDGNITVDCSSGSPFGILNCAIVGRAENDFDDITFNGNSITITYPDNPFLSPGDWRGPWGMAASMAQYDFVHRVVAQLPGPPAFNAYYERDWETNHDTFDLSAYDARISQFCNVLRIGENITNYTGLQSDVQTRIARIRSHAPHSRIIVTGQFWTSPSINDPFEAAAKAEHVLWIPLPGLDVGGNEIAVGDTLYDEDGVSYTAGSILVPHPNDAGMLAIADKIIEGIETPVTTPNWALSANGATATASVTNMAGSYAASSAIDGVRNTAGAYGSNHGWETGAGGNGSSFEVDFGQSRSIVEVDIFTLANAINYSSDPTLSDTFSLYGLTGYTLQYWDGATWQTITTVSGNNKVWRQHTFSPITTTKIRLSSMTGQDGDPRLIELEAWGTLDLAISTDTPLPSGAAGDDYHATLAATGSYGFIGFAKISGDAEVSVSSAGDVTMTAPAVGTYTFEAEVVDSLGQSATKSFTITIATDLTHFPTDIITGIHYYHYNMRPRDFDTVTDGYEFADGGMDFNERSDNPPRIWDIEFVHGLSKDQTDIFDAFWEGVRTANTFSFVDKYGYTYTNVRIKSYSRSHQGHRAWNKTVAFVLIQYSPTDPV